MATIIYCTGALSQAKQANGQDIIGVLRCSSGWVQAAYAPPFDPSQIDPVVVAGMFGGGFILYLTPWAAAWGASQMLKLLR